MNEAKIKQIPTLHFTYEWLTEDEAEVGGEFTLRLRSRAEGLMKWLIPDSEGIIKRPGEDDFEEFLRTVIHPDDKKTMLKEIKSGHFDEPARYEAAVMAWNNARGMADNVRMRVQTHMLELEMEAMELTIEQAKADSEPEEDEGEEAAPLSD